MAFFLSTVIYLNVSYLLFNNQHTSTRSLVARHPEQMTRPFLESNLPPSPPIVENVSMLVWPRIPKTGGRESITLLRLLIPQKNLIVNYLAGSAYYEDKKHYSVVPHEKNDLDIIPEQHMQNYMETLLTRNWKEKLELSPNASLYIAQYHLPFITLNNTDISSLLHRPDAQWKYISMIRKPIDRIVSSFYYIRGQAKGMRSVDRDYVTNYVPKIIEMQKNYTVNECAKSYDDGDNVCHFSTNYYVKWFCGGDKIVCDPFNISEASYNRAIQNIDAHFNWIGVLEYYQESMYALYRQFPLFFNHFEDSTAFNQSLAKHINIFRKQRAGARLGKTYYKKPSRESVAILNRKNAWDWKLYEYVVQKYGYGM